MRRSLPQQIAANKRASRWFVFLMLVLLAGLGTAIAGTYAPDQWYLGTAAAMAAGIVCACIAVWGGPKLVLTMSGAREATWEEDQMLSNVVEEMAIAAGLPKPKLMVIQDSAPNAFATGRDPKSGVIAVTTGLLEKLDRDELQGVVAHEMAHIRNYDVRFMTTVALVAGLIPLLADAYMRSLWWGGRSRRRSGGDQGAIIFLVIGIVLAVLAPVFAKLLEMAVSRQREYLADATAAQLTRYPEGLARALQKISSDTEPLEVANRATQHMYIINPLRMLSEGGALFSTHPPTQDRIRKLMMLAGNPSDPLDPVYQNSPPLTS
jgi:heat shock protein HtpX